jgi:hypothetical protein
LNHRQLIAATAAVTTSSLPAHAQGGSQAVADTVACIKLD